MFSVPFLPELSHFHGQHLNTILCKSSLKRHASIILGMCTWVHMASPTWTSRYYRKLTTQAGNAGIISHKIAATAIKCTQNQQQPLCFSHCRRFFLHILLNCSTGTAYHGLMHAQQAEVMTITHR